MDKSALQTIAQQLRQKKAQAEARLENLQLEARFNTVAFYDYLLNKVDNVASTGSIITDPSSYLEEEITKARAFFQNPLADSLSEGFNLHGIFPLAPTDNLLNIRQNVRPSTLSLLSDANNEPERNPTNAKRTLESNNLPATVNQSSGGQVESRRAKKKFCNKKAKDIELIDLVSDEEETLPAAATVSMLSASTSRRRIINIQNRALKATYAQRNESTVDNELPPKKRPRTAKQPHVVPSFSTQPNEILRKILMQADLPLHEQIVLRAVSPRFRDVLEDTLQAETSLTIHIGGDYCNYKYSWVEAKDLCITLADFKKEKCIQFIHRLFPGLTQLSLNSYSRFAWRKAGQLIRLYNGQLTTLKVSGSDLVNTQGRTIILTSLADAINSITTLTSLDLQLDVGCLLLPYLEKSLTRLRGLSLNRSWVARHLNQSSLLSSSLSPRCTQLQLCCSVFEELNGHFLAQLALNLTHLHLFNFIGTLPQALLPFRHLNSLTLYFNCFTKFPLCSFLLQQLRPFSQLTELTLRRVFYDQHPLEAPPSKKATLPSVKRLSLQLHYKISHLPPVPLDGAHLLPTLSSWFPNLSHLYLFSTGGFTEQFEASQERVPYTVTIVDKLKHLPGF